MVVNVKVAGFNDHAELKKVSCSSLPVADSACTDQDKQIWSQKGSAAFTSDMETCGHQCALADKSCASKCVQGKEGYSDSCSSCFGDLFGCTRDHCKLACIGGQTDACKDCVKKAGCPAPFTSCSGFAPPSNEVASTCSGSADPHVGICYQGSSSVLGESETIHVKVDSYGAGKGAMDLLGSGAKSISCLNKPFTKTGQNITTDLSDCLHVFGLSLNGVTYCSDQDKAWVLAKTGGYSPPQVDRIWGIWGSCYNIRTEKPYSIYLRGTISKGSHIWQVGIGPQVYFTFELVVLGLCANSLFICPGFYRN